MAGKYVKVNGHWEYESTDGKFGDDLAFLAPPAPDDGDYWGKWVYGSEYKTLTYSPGEINYEIRVGEIDSAEEAVDWLAQLEEKTWMSAQAMGDFVYAIESLVGLRGLAHPSKE